jgi:hypothetical protein
MIQSRKFVAAALLVGIALIIAGVLIAPFNASARAAATVGEDRIVDRIGAAFSTLSERDVDPALVAAAVQAAKGDLGTDASCAAGVWPNIDPSCLRTADGSRAHDVRMITIGYESDAGTTVLVRYPELEVASN